jgi:hypothetical protein
MAVEGLCCLDDQIGDSSHFTGLSKGLPHLLDPTIVCRIAVASALATRLETVKVELARKFAD